MIVFHCKTNSSFFTQDNGIKNQRRKIYIKSDQTILKIKKRYNFEIKVSSVTSIHFLSDRKKSK